MLEAAATRWRRRRSGGRAIIDQPEVWGLQSIAEEHVVIRIVVKTRTSERDDVDRELRARLKHAIDEMGITLPSLTSVVLTGFDGAGSVGGARPPRTVPTPHQQAPRGRRR